MRERDLLADRDLERGMLSCSEMLIHESPDTWTRAECTVQGANAGVWSYCLCLSSQDTNNYTAVPRSKLSLISFV